MKNRPSLVSSYNFHALCKNKEIWAYYMAHKLPCENTFYHLEMRVWQPSQLSSSEKVRNGPDYFGGMGGGVGVLWLLES